MERSVFRKSVTATTELGQVLHFLLSKTYAHFFRLSLSYNLNVLGSPFDDVYRWLNSLTLLQQVDPYGMLLCLLNICLSAHLSYFNELIDNLMFLECSCLV